MRVTVIAAASTNNVIGVDGKLPWNLPGDMQHFKEVTTGNWVVMGRNTYESIPEKYRPLPNRTNLVMTRNPTYSAPGAGVVSDPDDLECRLWSMGSVDMDLFVAGGEQIYRMFMGYGVLAHTVSRILLTRVHTTIDRLRDVARFPEIDPAKWAHSIVKHQPADARNAISFTIMEYTRRP